jgi:hypothetical protein
MFGNEIFIREFADASLWTNRVQTIDADVNGHLFTGSQFGW